MLKKNKNNEKKISLLDKKEYYWKLINKEGVVYHDLHLSAEKLNSLLEKKER